MIYLVYYENKTAPNFALGYSILLPPDYLGLPDTV